MKKKENSPLKTVLVIFAGLTVFFLITHKNWFLYSALIVGVSCLLSDAIAKFTDKVWMKLAYYLSFLGPPVFLSVVYFLILVPLAFISKIFRKKDQLLLKGEIKTTFTEVTRSTDKSGFEKSW